MKQAWISESLEGLDQDLIRKYNLREYTDPTDTLGVFGMYREEDFQKLIDHKGDCIVVWFGSDAKDLPGVWIAELSKHMHVAISVQVQNSLSKKGIRSIYLPINATIADEWPYTKRGDKIYWYYNEGCPEFYGSEYIAEIEKLIKIPIIKAQYDTFTRAQLYDVYSQCFLNLRLTPHDGCPNTNLQMGLMGRKSVYNGDLPHSIAWTDVDDICDAIIREYANRHNPDSVSKDFFNFVNLIQSK